MQYISKVNKSKLSLTNKGTNTMTTSTNQPVQQPNIDVAALTTALTAALSALQPQPVAVNYSVKQTHTVSTPVDTSNQLDLDAIAEAAANEHNQDDVPSGHTYELDTVYDGDTYGKFVLGVITPRNALGKKVQLIQLRIDNRLVTNFQIPTLVKYGLLKAIGRAIQYNEDNERTMTLKRAYAAVSHHQRMTSAKTLTFN
ncbi:MAG: hypothetical protein GY679_04170 [Mycoplasma sp.]|nr:hypothetical protein [Mycoplasma sp.]